MMWVTAPRINPAEISSSEEMRLVRDTDNI